MVARNAGSATVSVLLWTRTFSSAGCEKPALWRIACARDASPVAFSASDSLTTPAALPIATDAITNAIHANVAVFQCAALHRPARAARFPLSISAPCRLLADPFVECANRGQGCAIRNHPERTLIRAYAFSSAAARSAQSASASSRPTLSRSRPDGTRSPSQR